MVLEYLDRMSLTVVAEDSVLYESPYWGQHGVSFLVEAYHHNIRKNTLVDVGQNHEALLHNMKEMNISPEIIDSIVLTHCHYDHTADESVNGVMMFTILFSSREKLVYRNKNHNSSYRGKYNSAKKIIQKMR